MKQMKCSLCGGEMKRNGQTKAVTQRWRCKAYNTSTTCNYRKNEQNLESFFKTGCLAKKRKKRKANLTVRFANKYRNTGITGLCRLYVKTKKPLSMWTGCICHVLSLF